MFICEKCTERCLTDAGRSYWWPQSAGGCELCDNRGVCNDVPSGCAWAWKSSKKAWETDND